MPGHQCRFAVRALVASPHVLFLEASISRIALDGLSHASTDSPNDERSARLDAVTPTLRSAQHTPHTPGTESSTSGNGISTVCPSPTPFGLGLGPTNPPRMNLAAETSAIRWGRLLTSLTLLMPAFSLPSAPPPLTGRLRCAGNAPLPRPRCLKTRPSAASAPG